ncbi:MAG TPA: hypothetical protein VH309_15170 [Elusimicrobiota bacterium]|nr:hypothetical protein [Elusimicrobiota bacterium]
MPKRTAAAALLAILALAALARAPCLRTEPWLDEVWSLDLARQAKTAADVFTKIHDDNSNPLNTLYLRLVSGSRDWASYRLLSLAAGLLTVALLGWDPEDRARGLLAALLAALSTHMVLFATEARGYALAAFFSLACFLLLRPARPPSVGRAAAFGLCALLAFLSHPTFAYVFAALFVWAAVRLPPERRIRGLLGLFGPPALAIAAFEAIQYPVLIGGANPDGLRPVLLRTLDLWSGAPERGAAALAGAALVAALLAWELWNVRRERPGGSVFFAALFAGALAFVAAFPFPFERHFFVCLPFALMLAAGGLLRLWRSGGARRAAAAVLVLLFLIGNGVRDRALASAGRGHYLEAVQRMAADTPGSLITVGGDHDARNKMMLDYYARYLPRSKRLEYLPAGRRRAAPPEWFLLHGFFTDPRLAPIGVSLAGAASYRLVEVYPYSGLSGWTWMLYRRDEK